MKISNIETYRIQVPLLKPFKTALRIVNTADSVYVKIQCDNGLVGWGEATATAVITGDTLQSIETAIHDFFKPHLIGKDILCFEEIFHDLSAIMTRNSSGRAAIDMAIYDCLAQNSKLPLYQYLGGRSSRLETDFTVSVDIPHIMGEEALEYVKSGFTTLKVKVGLGNINEDIARVKEIRKCVGNEITIRLDANQGWTAKEAIQAIRRMEDMGLQIELVEQPVKADDLEGLRQVTNQVNTFIMADESVFTPRQALEVIRTRSADMINIKLMKTGGIFYAQYINQLAEAAGMECMMGSMIETHLGLTAAAHFAASKRNITRYDFDAPLMLSRSLIEGGIQYKGNKFTLPEIEGLGIRSIQLN